MVIFIKKSEFLKFFFFFSTFNVHSFFYKDALQSITNIFNDTRSCSPYFFYWYHYYNP